jgi:hypothetical protein
MSTYSGSQVKFQPITVSGPLYGEHLDDIRSHAQTHQIDSRLQAKELSKNPYMIDLQLQSLIHRQQSSQVPDYLFRRGQNHQPALAPEPLNHNDVLHQYYTHEKPIRFMGRESYVPLRRPHYSNIRDS